MKSGARASILIVLAAALLCTVLSPGGLLAASDDKFKPTPPPQVPAADFNSVGRKYLDFTFLYADIDVVTLMGFGAGLNYVSMYKNLGWNVSGGAFYLTGDDEDGTMDITGVMVPLTANVAFRPYERPNGNCLIFFGGLHYSWTGVYVDMSSGMEIDVSLRTYGPMFGAKAKFMMKPGLAFIPYWVFKYESYDGEVNVDGTVSDLDIDSAAVHLIGFDIEIGAISVGAMLDMISNSDRDMIIISFTYNLDYGEGAAAQPEPAAAKSQKAPQRGRAAK